VKKGYYVKKTQEDGNCLFRAIADQIYGDEDMHIAVRKLCMDYMEKERDHFSQFVTEDFTSYVARKREDKCFGNNIEMQAISEVYCRPIEVYHGRSLVPLNIFHGSYNTDYPPIRLSYHHGNHYNSIVDPNNPSVGVGLGLPAYKPGLADKMQVMEALRLSEQDDIEKAFIETSRQSSEYQEIEREIEEAVLAASRAEYIASIFASVPIPTSVSASRSPTYPSTTTTTSTMSPPHSPPYAATTTTTTTTTTSSDNNNNTQTSNINNSSKSSFTIDGP
jgi:OTU domain-containing protein 5